MHYCVRVNIHILLHASNTCKHAATYDICCRRLIQQDCIWLYVTVANNNYNNNKGQAHEIKVL